MMLKAPFDLDTVKPTPVDAPYMWEPTQADWDELMSRPILPSPIVEQEYAPVFHWSNPDGN